jgi:outer membrane protein OmpA-like peptidoglycan-associated protein
VSKSRMLTVALDNVRLDSVPNIHNSTYKIFLAYNGTLGVLNKYSTTVVKRNQRTFDSSNINFSFDPGMVSPSSREMLDEVVIDIKMFNGC